MYFRLEKMEIEEFINKKLNNYQTKLSNYIKSLLKFVWSYENIISISKLDNV